MTSSHSNSSDSERLEQIVAYLDGELSADESEHVERRLASDEDFRQELQSIDRAWVTLDELPLETVEDRFAKTTMEMVVQTAQHEVDEMTQALPVQRRRHGLQSLLLASTAILLGFLIARLAWQNPNRPLVADLPVIQHIDAYSQFQGVDFLRRLAREVEPDSWPAKEEELEADLKVYASIASPGTRRTWLESVDQSERMALRANFNRFRALSQENKERLGQLHLAIDSAEDSELLRRTMFQYEHWLSHLPASQQYELRALSDEQRARRVADMLNRQAARSLSEEELKTLARVVGPYIEKNRQRVNSQPSPADRERHRSFRGSMLRMPQIRKELGESLWQDEEFRQDFYDALPDAKRESFQALPLREKRWQFLSWMWDAFMLETSDRARKRRPRQEKVTEQELEEFFTEELDAATKEALLALPLEKMRRELEQRYHGELPRPHWEGVFDRESRPPHPPGPPPDEDWRGEGRQEGPRFRGRRPPPGRRFGDPPPDRRDRRPQRPPPPEDA